LRHEKRGCFMKVLLLSANTETINMAVLPVGLAGVAAAAEQAGHEIRVLNLMGTNDPAPALKNTISAFSPDVIGISLRNIDDQDMHHTRFLVEPVKQIIAACRQLTDAPLVLGGAGYSIFPQAALDYLQADIGIRGEGEAAFIQLLQKISEHADVSAIAGLYLPETGCRVERQYIRALHAHPVPLPDRHLPIPPTPGRSELWVPFQTRRGCPMNCSYCSTGAIEGRLIRKIPPERAVEALSRYTEAGFTRFFFVDNTFNLPPAYAERLCDAIINSGLSIAWRSIVYPWKITQQLASKMAEAGCTEVSLGFESGSEPVLKRLNKRFRPPDVRQAANIFKACRIARMGFLLLGGPGETRETALESLHWADSLGLDNMKLTVGIRIYPDTALATTAISEGIIAPADDLLIPKFYIQPELKTWLYETAAQWAAQRSHWFFKSP